MAKKKKNRSIQSNSGDLKATEGLLQSPEMLDATSQIFDCTDPEALLKKHLAYGVEAVHAYVTVAFASLFVEYAENPDEITEPPNAVMDYLRLACRALGMHSVALALDSGIIAALDAFRDSPVDLDKNAVKNAKALDLLMK